MKQIVSIEKPYIMSEISKDVAQIFFGAMFVGPIIGENINWFMTSSGLLLSLVFWSTSVVISKK